MRWGWGGLEHQRATEIVEQEAIFCTSNLCFSPPLSSMTRKVQILVRVKSIKVRVKLWFNLDHLPRTCNFVWTKDKFFHTSWSIRVILTMLNYISWAYVLDSTLGLQHYTTALIQRHIRVVINELVPLNIQSVYHVYRLFVGKHLFGIRASVVINFGLYRSTICRDSSSKSVHHWSE